MNRGWAVPTYLHTLLVSECLWRFHHCLAENVNAVINAEYKDLEEIFEEMQSRRSRLLSSAADRKPLALEMVRLNGSDS